MRRALIKLGDKTTAGGTVIEGELASRHHGTPLSYHGASIYCPACKQTGKACNVPPMRPMRFMGKQALLENDICLCGCQPPPRLIASQSTMHVSFDHEELARMGFGPTGQPLPKAAPLKEVTESSYKETDQKSTLQDDPDLICPNMSNAEFAQRMMQRREKALSLMDKRIAELKSGSPAAKARVIQWFGNSDAITIDYLFTGLIRIRHVLSELTPANFVRYSEAAMANVGCVSNSKDKVGVVAEVCGPDTATHTIAIHLDFCELRDFSYTMDSQVSTLIHEVSHFNDTMSTRDPVYFMRKCRNLAKSNPQITLHNADSIAGYVIYED